MTLRESLSKVARQPSVFVAEVAWRWIFWGAALTLFGFGLIHALQNVFLTDEEQQMLTSMSPLEIAQGLLQLLHRALPYVLQVAMVAIPGCVLLWLIAFSFGRTVVVGKLAGVERPCWSGVIGINVLRIANGVALVAGYVVSSVVASRFVNPEAPNIAVVLAVFLVCFGFVLLLWSVVQSNLGLAALFPVTRGAGLWDSLREAKRFRSAHRGVLASMGFQNAAVRTLVAVVITILALLPLPLIRIAPPMFWVLELVLLLAYALASDFFLVARLAAVVGLVQEQLHQRDTEAQRIV